MKTPSLSLLRAYSPLRQQVIAPWTARGCLGQHQQQQKAGFSTTQQRQKKNTGGPVKDTRVSLIRYFLGHPLTPRPLRFSRARYLRHWTIHRAWNLYQSKLRAKRKNELIQQYQSMHNACEALRLMDTQGFTAEERAKLGLREASEGSFGKLYRVAMLKYRIWDNVPIEYARIQTDTPPKNGWNHDWTK